MAASPRPSGTCRYRALTGTVVTARDRSFWGPYEAADLQGVAFQSVEDWSIISYKGEEPPDLTALLGPSLDEQHGLVRRTINEGADGTNRFNKPGEVFYVASVEDETVGMCGLNIDPFVDDGRIGRIRHLYVHPEYRRRQIGRSLVDACLRCAAESFIRVRLRTFRPVAASFYESIGFAQVHEPAATHSLKL